MEKLSMPTSCKWERSTDGDGQVLSDRQAIDWSTSLSELASEGASD
jgi:hypothetical protein